MSWNKSLQSQGTRFMLNMPAVLCLLLWHGTVVYDKTPCVAVCLISWMGHRLWTRLVLRHNILDLSFYSLAKII